MQERQCWYQSLLTVPQRIIAVEYPGQDFKFWVRHGSWSRCPHCGSMHFNDQYFQKVYSGEGTATSNNAVLAARVDIPSDPCQHMDGQVGVSSRWWFLPGMYKPGLHCGACGRKTQETTKSEEAGVVSLAATHPLTHSSHLPAHSLIPPGLLSLY